MLILLTFRVSFFTKLPATNIKIMKKKKENEGKKKENEGKKKEIVRNKQELKRSNKIKENRKKKKRIYE